MGIFMGLFTLWGVLVSGMQCSPKGPMGFAGWYTFSVYLRRWRMANDQTLYCLLMDGLRTKPWGCLRCWRPNLTIFIHLLHWETTEWESHLIIDVWCLGHLMAVPHVLNFHTAVFRSTCSVSCWLCEWSVYHLISCLKKNKPQNNPQWCTYSSLCVFWGCTWWPAEF